MDGYLVATIALPGCPSNVTLEVNGVSLPAPYRVVEEEGSCRVLVDTRGLSPYRLAPGDTIRLRVEWPGGGGWLEARVPGEEGGSVNTTAAAPGEGGLYTLPPPEGVQGNGGPDNTLEGGARGYLWLAASIALGAASILVGVREYGRGGGG